MTAEEMQRLVVQGDEKGLVNAVSALSEAERAALLLEAQALFKAYGGTRADPGPRNACAALALIATGSLQESLYVCTRDDGVPRDLVAQVLVDRKPAWADDWLARKLKIFDSVQWHAIEMMVAGGACKRPESWSYHAQMGRDLACGYVLMPGEPMEKRRALSDFFRERTDLHPALWGLIERPGGTFLIHETPWEGTAQEEPWPLALKNLSAEGVLDRGRLLRAVLAMMAEPHGGGAGSAAVVTFFDGLEPTPEELASFHDDFIGLLASDWKPVVESAIKRLGQLAEAGKLDDGAFVKAAGPLFKSAPVVTLKRCFPVLKAIGARDEKQRPEVLKLLLAKGIKHANDGIAAQAIGLLTIWDEHLSPAQRKQVAARRDSLPEPPPEFRETLAEDKAFGQAQRTAAREGQADVQAALVARAKAIPATWRKRAGVDACLAALKRGEFPPPVSFDVMEVPVLSGVAPVEPIPDVEALIDATSKAVESCDDTIEFFRVLDGISRLWKQRPDGFERLARPLSKRIRKILNQDTALYALANDCHCDASGIHLLLGWLDGAEAAYVAHDWFFDERPVDVKPYKGIGRYRNYRGIWERIVAGVEAPLLCLPTHEGGWIDAQVFVERIRAYEAIKTSPCKDDLIQALLRIAPDNRAAALKGCKGLKSPESRAVRWALGDRKAGMRAGDDPDVWLAACRAREPKATVNLTVGGKLLGVGVDAAPYPNGIEAATYHWDLVPEGEEAMTHVGKIPCVAMPRLRALTTPPTPEHPTTRTGYILCVHQLVCGKVPRNERPYLWPQNREGCHAYAAQEMASWLDEKSWYLRELGVGMESAQEPDQPVSESLMLAVGIGMMCADVNARMAAVDALTSMVDDGRVTPMNLVQTLSWLEGADWFRLARLSESLVRVGTVSPLHRWTVAGTLQAIVARWDALPNHAHHILALLLELLAPLGESLDGAAAKALGGIKASGKSAKVVKRLLELESADNGAMAEAREMALQARIARAERWAAADR